MFTNRCYRTNNIRYKQPHKTSVTASMWRKRQKILTLCHSQTTSQYVLDCCVDQLIGIKTQRWLTIFHRNSWWQVQSPNFKLFKLHTGYEGTKCLDLSLSGQSFNGDVCVYLVPCTSSSCCKIPKSSIFNADVHLGLWFSCECLSLLTLDNIVQRGPFGDARVKQHPPAHRPLDAP